MLMLMSLWCPVRTCWHKRKHKHKGKTISQLASTNAYMYVNDVLTKHKHKKKPHVYAYACVASEDRA